MTHTHAKGQGQMSISSKDKSGNGRTEEIALHPLLTRSVNMEMLRPFVDNI